MELTLSDFKSNQPANAWLDVFIIVCSIASLCVTNGCFRSRRIAAQIKIADSSTVYPDVSLGCAWQPIHQSWQCLLFMDHGRSVEKYFDIHRYTSQVEFDIPVGQAHSLVGLVGKDWPGQGSICLMDYGAKYHDTVTSSATIRFDSFDIEKRTFVGHALGNIVLCDASHKQCALVNLKEYLFTTTSVLTAPEKWARGDPRMAQTYLPLQS